MDAFPPNLLDSARDYATQNPPQSPGETTPKSSTTHTTTTTATLAADDGNDDDDYECNRIPTPFPELPEPEPEPKLGLLSFVKQQMDEHELEMLQQREVERQLSADMWEEEGCLYNDNDYDYRCGYDDDDDDDDDDYKCGYGGSGGGAGADAEGDEDDEVVVGYSYLPEDRGGRLPMTSTPLRGRGRGGRNATAVKHGERLPETSIISLITDSDSTPAPVPAPEGGNDDDDSDIIITYATPIRKPLPNRRPSSLLSPPYFSSTRLPSLCLSSPSHSPSPSPSPSSPDGDSDSDSDSSLAITNVTPIKRPPPPPSQHNSASSSSSSTRPPKKRRRYADHAYTEDFKTGPWGYKDRLLLARALQRGIDFIALGQSMRRDVDDVFEKFEKVVKAGFYRCKMRDRGTQTD